MIIKARAGQGGQALVRYLEGGKNERAEVLQFRNMNTPSLKAAIYDMDMTALGSKAEKHALHVQMRAANDEHLTPEQWGEAVDRYAEMFGMQDHQAAVILHTNPDGSTHCHIVFNRVHPETLKAAHLSHNYAKHKTLARELERDFNLQQVSNEKTNNRDYSNTGENEQKQAHKCGANVHDIRDKIRDAWEQSDNGQSFQAALEEQGFILARGDRRDFVALDAHGKPYSIGSRTTGAKAAEVREKLKDLNPDNVPTIEQAQHRQQERRVQQREAETIKQQFEQTQQPQPANAYSMEGATGAVVDWWKAARYRLEQNQPEPEKEASPEVTQDFNQNAEEQHERAKRFIEKIKREPAPEPERELTREERIAARLAKYESDLQAARERKNENGRGRSRSRNFAQEQREAQHKEEQERQERIIKQMRKHNQQFYKNYGNDNDYENER